MEEFKSPSSKDEPSYTRSDYKLINLFSLEEYLFAGLILLSIVGIAITNYSDKYVLTYWIIMVPVFAVVNIYHGCANVKKSGKNISNVIKNQVLQWVGLLIAVLLVFKLVNYGNLSSNDAGYFIIILLSLTTYIVGVQYNRRLIILAVLLGLTAGIVGIIEHFFWIILLLTIIASVAVFIKKRRPI